MSKAKTNQQKPEEFTEGVDYYFDNGSMILTAHFLLRRGYCCGNGCRNCPYRETAAETSKQENF